MGNDHFHVGRRINSSTAAHSATVECVESAALAAVRLNVQRAGAIRWMGDGCERGGCRVCGWCRAEAEATNVVHPAVLMATTRASLMLQTQGGVNWVFETPTGGVEIWATAERTERETCPRRVRPETARVPVTTLWDASAASVGEGVGF
jgi:hypothetical protein